MNKVCFLFTFEIRACVFWYMRMIIFVYEFGRVKGGS